MNRVDSSVKKELLELQTIAKQRKSWEQVFLKERDITILLCHVLPQASSMLLVEALKQDLRVMSLHEAIATWCDTDNGLGNQFPQQILQVAKSLMPVKDVKSTI